MAEKVDDIRQRRFYPWDKWCDGNAWQVERGKDFDLSRTGFRHRLYEIAASRGMKVSTHLVGLNSIQFQFRSDPTQ